ncbi:alkylphosphonate utilization operon protein PhnA [Magnetococcus marinus MC-1]|uniref:Alkylphosphonate utilization operon protein PhnA n=1 Tax=Magnetococcus marinus (strain ATCC BAA-1437 / JCM 17883 / MC-1) TaxID=156889 RepID=A0LAP0_MAGMM|nr:zinc ribbon domain-containing protein YjdM [Magnetococcus marinus]ABK45033.1 alkylphosphonate utilization operon protein PhnA [Magnetococcus marinus MC-1]
MSDAIPPCPKCNSAFAYADGPLYICPECGHEWPAGAVAAEDDALVVKDAYGTLLQQGDNVTLIKDLKVKGSSSVAKIGTKVTISRLVEGDHNIDCKIAGIGAMMLKSEFVKKA